jgi:hypothetical protein
MRMAISWQRREQNGCSWMWQGEVIARRMLYTICVGPDTPQTTVPAVIAHGEVGGTDLRLNSRTRGRIVSLLVCQRTILPTKKAWENCAHMVVQVQEPLLC